MRVFAWTLVLVGLAVGLWGFMKAFAPVAQLYRQAMTDPLGDSMPDDGGAVARQMIVPAIVGVLGGGVGTVGSIMLLVQRRQRKARARSAAMSAASTTGSGASHR